jgi:hypothetical protein
MTLLLKRNPHPSFEILLHLLKFTKIMQISNGNPYKGEGFLKNSILCRERSGVRMITIIQFQKNAKVELLFLDYKE